MIDSLNAVLPIFIYVLLIIFLVIGIILGIKLIITIDKVNEIIDNLKEKISSLDSIFNIISGVSDKFGLLSSKLTDIVLSVVNKIRNLRNRKDEFEDYE